MNSEQISKLFEEIDSKNIIRMGFSPGRYLTTMRETYERFIESENLKRSGNVACEIEKSGNMILNEILRIIVGAKSLFEWASKNYVLA